MDFIKNVEYVTQAIFVKNMRGDNKEDCNSPYLSFYSFVRWFRRKSEHFANFCTAIYQVKN